MRSIEKDNEIKAREQHLRERQAALDEREALLLAKEADLDRVEELRRSEEEEEDLVAEVRRSEEEAIAAGKQPRASAAGNAWSTEVPRLQYVARELLRAHGKDMVIMIINRLREVFAPNITLTELQNIGGEHLVNTLVAIAAEHRVEPPALSEMIEKARVYEAPL